MIIDLHLSLTTRTQTDLGATMIHLWFSERLHKIQLKLRLNKIDAYTHDNYESTKAVIIILNEEKFIV